MNRHATLAAWLAATAIVSVGACGLGPSAPTPTPSARMTSLVPTRWIAYETCVKCDGTDGADGGIWLTHPDGSGSHGISSQLGYAHQPDFSRDGKSIAYEGGTGDTAPSQIYVADADGSNPHIVGKCEPPTCLSNERPAWSPDGTLLAFSTDSGPPKNDLPTALGIAILNLPSGQVAEVIKHAATDGEDYSPRWSPDGRYLVFWRVRHAKDGVSEETAIYIVGSDGSNLHQLTPWDELAGDPDWSPNGTLIAYSTHPGKIFDQGDSELVTIRPDGAGRTVITKFGPNGPRGDHPRWTPDGRTILYTQFSAPGAQPYYRNVWVIGSDGKSNTPVLTTRPIMVDPVIQP